MMDPVDREVMTAFGQGERPHEGELVVWDGFDVLDKEGAVRFFSGKSWADVLAHLRGLKDEPVFGGAYFHEEWSVLNPQALAYYARAYLEFLRETVGTAQENEEFVSYFLGALYQVFYRHKGSPFSPTQTNLLRRIVERIREKAAALEAFDYFVDDIESRAAQVLTEMDAHGRNGS
jgi:hypothetical protein